MSRNILVICLVVATSSCNLAFCENATNLQEAEAAEKKEDYRTAQRLYEDYLTAHPDDAASIRKLAHAMFFQRRPAEAYEKLMQAYRIDPRKSELPALVLGGLYAEFGDYQNAEIWMKNAIKKGADELPTQLLLARWALNNGDLDKALWSAERALTIDPRSLEANIIRGQIALLLKEYKIAQRCFEKAETQSPEDCATRNGMALALCEQDERATKAKALSFSEANFRKYPKNLDAAITHARVLYRLGRIEEADKVIRQIDTARADLSPNKAYYVACIAADRGRKEEGTEMIRQALDDERVPGMRERPGSMKTETVALLARLYPDPKQEKLKPGDMVIVVCRDTGYVNHGGMMSAGFSGGTRLKVVNVAFDGDYLQVEGEKGRQGTVRRKDVAKLQNR